MNKSSLIFGAVAAILAVAVIAGVVCFLDPWNLYILCFASLLWIGLPALFFAGVLWLIAVCTGRSRRPALILLSIFVGSGCFVGLAIPASDFVQGHFVAAAQEYAVRVAPLLEAYRETHGSYPASLEQLPNKPSLPWLLRSPHSYGSDGTRYFFSFAQPGGLIDTWTFDSKTQKWHLST